jgi:putative hemolysin
MALISCSPIRLKRLAEEGRGRAAYSFVENPDMLFGTTLLGTNLCVVLNSSLITWYLHNNYHVGSELYTTLILSPLVLLFGEMLPKAYAQAHSEKVGMAMAPALRVFSKVFSPVSSIILFTARLLTPADDKECRDSLLVKKEELRILLDRHFEGSDILEEEKELIKNIFSFGEVRVRESMKPLIEVVALNEDDPVTKAVKLIQEKGFSRLPVYSGNIFKIIGIVSVYDIMQAERGDIQVKEFLRPALFVSEFTYVDDLLRRMQMDKQVMAIVVNEHGACVGIITVEDILEELVGEIEDEYDLSLSRGEKRVEKVEGGYVVDARIELDVLEEKLGLRFDKRDVYETLAGHILYHTGFIPEEGSRITLDGVTMYIQETTERSVKKVFIPDMSCNVRM